MPDVSLMLKPHTRQLFKSSFKVLKCSCILIIMQGSTDVLITASDDVKKGHQMSWPHEQGGAGSLKLSSTSSFSINKNWRKKSKSNRNCRTTEKSFALSPSLWRHNNERRFTCRCRQQTGRECCRPCFFPLAQKSRCRRSCYETNKVLVYGAVGNSLELASFGGSSIWKRKAKTMKVELQIVVQKAAASSQGLHIRFTFNYSTFKWTMRDWRRRQL